MKVLVLLSLFCLAWSAPQTRQSFQDHFNDFMELTRELEGDHFRRQTSEYLKFEEFLESLAYLTSLDFKEILVGLVDEPEFIAVNNYLQNLGVEIEYYLELAQNLADEYTVKERSLRHPITGRTMITYFNDIVSMFPRRKLDELFQKKMNECDDFKYAVNGLKSEEWKKIYDALWENEVFKTKVAELASHDFDLQYILNTLLSAYFGQIEPFPTNFQDHFDDFVDLIEDLEGQHFIQHAQEYMEFDEFKKSLDFLSEIDFMVVLQSLLKQSDYKVMDTYLKANSVFPAYYIDRFHLLIKKIKSGEIFDTMPKSPCGSKRHSITGATMSSFLKDVVQSLPATELSKMFDNKMENAEEFKSFIEGLRSDEWKEMYENLWNNDEFEAEVAKLAEYDFDVAYFFNNVIPSIFGRGDI